MMVETKLISRYLMFNNPRNATDDNMLQIASELADSVNKINLASGLEL